MTIAVKEAGNQLKLSATSLVSSSVSKELFEVSRLCQAYKRVSREDRNQRKKEKGEIAGYPLIILWFACCYNIKFTVCSPAVCSIRQAGSDL